MGNAHELSVWDFHFAIYFLVTTYKSSLFQVSVTLYGQKTALDLISAAKTLFWVEWKPKGAQRGAKLLFSSQPLKHAHRRAACTELRKRGTSVFFTCSASSYLFKSHCSTIWNTGPWMFSGHLCNSTQRFLGSFPRGKTCTRSNNSIDGFSAADYSISMHVHSRLKGNKAETQLFSEAVIPSQWFSPSAISWSPEQHLS